MIDPVTTVGGAATGPLRGSGLPLERAILTALDDLEQALQLESLGDNRFRANSEPSRFGRVFGGQLLAQAMVAAGATVDGQPPNSLHAYFAGVGASDVPLDIAVERTRDGRSMSTREVRITQHERPVLTAILSFHDNPVEAQQDAQAPKPASDPESVPLLQHWADLAAPELRPSAQNWIDLPPPLELRIDEPPTFMAQAPSRDGVRAHWMRLPRDVTGPPASHEALLAYASDYLLLDMAFRAHPRNADYRSFTGLSLDHSLWLHAPIKFDEWHLYTQETVSVAGHRALVRGAIFDAAGHRVASTAQDVLVRPITR